MANNVIDAAKQSVSGLSEKLTEHEHIQKRTAKSIREAYASGNVTIHIDTMNVRKEQDIDTVAQALAEKIRLKDTSSRPRRTVLVAAAMPNMHPITTTLTMITPTPSLRRIR